MGVNEGVLLSRDHGTIEGSREGGVGPSALIPNLINTLDIPLSHLDRPHAISIQPCAMHSDNSGAVVVVADCAWSSSYENVNAESSREVSSVGVWRIQVCEVKGV